MTNDNQSTTTIAIRELNKLPLPDVDTRVLERAFAGSRAACHVGGGQPSRLPSGEWMFRISFDLPEAMRDALEDRAGGDQARMGEIIRAALVAAGVGEPGHVPGICDGTYSDDKRDAEREAFRKRFYDGLAARREQARAGR